MLETLAQPGDQWDVTDAWRDARAHNHNKLALGPGWDVLLQNTDGVLLRGVATQDILARHDGERHALVWSGNPAWSDAPAKQPADGAVLTLVALPSGARPALFELHTYARAPATPAPERISERGVRLRIDAGDSAVLRERPVTRDAFDLSRQSAVFAASPGFDELISLPMLREVELFPHQLKTARTVLRRFRGRALLCDEVGLGKTIEAGMILLELIMRKLARRVLVLTPSSLVEQWRGELRRKFGVAMVTPDDDAFKSMGDDAWGAHDRVLASYHKARREPQRGLIAAQEWDLVIVDEAHHCRNRNTMLWKLVASLRKRYTLLLTATPVQNNLDELYNLVTLLQPGLLSTSKRFQQQFVDRKDKLTPRNLDQLHGLLAEAMVRNRRSNVSVGLTRRYATTQPVALAADERALYDDVTRFVREHLRTAKDDGDENRSTPPAKTRKTGQAFSRIALITLQKELGSSGAAAADTLERLSEHGGPRAAWLRETASRARSIGNSKLTALRALAQSWPDKLLIFTQFRRTQTQITHALREMGEHAVEFHGGMTRIEKEHAVRDFQADARFLISTESGSEGRNLQFCNGLCNFDLPWNPMRIEQRIGRLSRIGQTRDVRIFNLLADGTIESDILRTLEAKINLFELVVGETQMILGNLDEEREFEDIVLDMWIGAQDDAQFRAEMNLLGDKIVEAKRAYLDQVAYEDRLFANRFAPDES